MGRAALGALVGLLVIAAGVSFAFGAAVAGGVFGRAAGGPIDLTPALWARLVGGVVVAWPAAWVAARVGGSAVAARLLAGAVVLLGLAEGVLIEATPELADGARVIAPALLVFGSPLIVGAVVLGAAGRPKRGWRIE